MAVTRTFLGWDGPPLERACDLLLERAGAGGDLSSLVVVTTASRLGRVMLGMLVDRAAGRPLSPPMFVTIGEVADVVLGEQGRVAGPVARRLAWERALEQAGELSALLPGTGAGRGGDRRGVAAMLLRLHDELIGEGIRFADVAARGELDDVEAARWADAARVQARYERELTEAGLVDSGLSRLKALESGAVAKPGGIVLVGVPELSGVARRALLLSGADVEAMVAAPPGMADLFDELGMIRVEVWKGREVPLREESVVFAEDYAAQAGFAFGAIAKLGGKYSVHDVVLGIPDAEVGPHLERAARRYGGVVARSAAGEALRSSAPARLLAGIGRVLEKGTFAAYAALARHPDMERYLLRQLGGNREERWLAAMDEYATKRLPGRVEGEMGPGSSEDGQAARVLREVKRLLGSLLRGSAAPENLLAVMRQVYMGNRVSREDPDAAPTIQACREIQQGISQVAALPDSWRPGTGAALIRTVLEVCGDKPLPMPSTADVIEMLGWLELPLDPTPVAIITGVNDGSLPESYRADAMLPDGLRSRLGVPCSERRLARDTYLLTLVVKSRKHVTLISGRRSSDGKPLAPSRLLFAADARTVVGRVRRLCESTESTAQLKAKEGPGVRAGWVERPRVEVAAVTSMEVTAFKTFLDSPYRFYLEKVLGLKEVARPEPEMDPMAFGDIVHKVMEQFARGEARDMADAGRIREFLLDHLELLATERFGSSPAMAVRVQLEMARMRLEEVAQWQAGWRADGWVILEKEWNPKGGVALPGADPSFRVRGQIDRIDVKEGDKALGAAIIDFKTGESADSPITTHGRRGKWKDLQLPLYRHLAASLELPPDRLSLGYVPVTSRPGQVGFKPGDWDEEDLADADAKAREIAARVMRGDFFDLGKRPPLEGTLAAIAGTALAAARKGEDDE
ncbi:MAG: PD-(D/E)XK nuclease family protein [Phycisphaeraceae bacterium]|nr:PD-(D/E)XK nuclease family protein [Phycisphaeraceae bacterium]